MTAVSTVQKQLDRIKKQLESGSYYEAQQTYKSTYHRYRSKRAFTESYAVLKAGALEQLQHGQTTCGAELALLLLEAYKTDSVEASPSNVKELEAIIETFPCTAEASSSQEETVTLEECERVVVAAVNWAEKQGAYGCCQGLHDAAARQLWASYGWKQFGRASMHFCRGRDAEAFASALAAVAKQAKPSEVGLLVARAVLQTLAAAKHSCSQQESHAAILLDHCLQLGLISDSPMSNFLAFLLKSLERQSHKLFDLVRSKYELCWSKDPSFEAYLVKIERRYFQSQNTGGPMGGLLGNIMSMLQEGDEE